MFRDKCYKIQWIWWNFCSYLFKPSFIQDFQVTWHLSIPIKSISSLMRNHLPYVWLNPLGPYVSFINFEYLVEQVINCAKQVVKLWDCGYWYTMIGLSKIHAKRLNWMSDLYKFGRWNQAYTTRTGDISLFSFKATVMQNTDLIATLRQESLCHMPRNDHMVDRVAESWPSVIKGTSLLQI